MIKGFKEFITRGNVVDLAVGVVIGAAFTQVINALVDGFINPLIAAIFGKPDLSHVLTWTLNDAGTPADVSDDAILSIGLILTALINFLLVAIAIYFFIVLPLNKVAAMKKKDETIEAAGPTEIELLTEIRDALAKK